jgi:hypothetical protein
MILFDIIASQNIMLIKKYSFFVLISICTWKVKALFNVTHFCSLQALLLHLFPLFVRALLVLVKDAKELSVTNVYLVELK